MDPGHPVHRRPHRLRPGGGVGRVDDDREAREAADEVRLRDQPVARLHLAPAVLHRLGAEHEMGEVHVPLVGGNVGALRHVAEVAQIALVHDLAVVGPAHPVHLHRRALVDEVEQGGEGVAEAHAAPAAVADVEHPLELAVERLLVVERGVAPVDGMAGRRPEAALPHPLRVGGGGNLRSAGGRRWGRRGRGRSRSRWRRRFRRRRAPFRGGGIASLSHHRLRLPPAAGGGGGRRRTRAGTLRRDPSPLVRRPARRAPSGSGWRGTARPWRGSRTSPRPPRAPRRGRSWPSPGTCRCTRGSRPRWRP